MQSSSVSNTDVQVGSQEALECMPKEFPQLKNKKKYIKNRFKVKNTKAVYIAPNSFIQLSCFIEGIPNDKANNCLIIFSNSPKLCFETLGGLLPKIIAPKTCKFEYVTKKQGVQLSQNQIIGYAFLLSNDISACPLNNEIVMENIPPTFNHFCHNSSPFVYLNPSQDIIKNLNLYNEASNKAGFQIISDLDKIDSRPLEQQLKINENTLLKPAMKSKLISLCQKYEHIWSHISGKLPYGSSESLEFEIELTNPDTSPVKQKPRQLNTLQAQSLQTQIDDWVRAGKAKEYDVAPPDSWVSNFHAVIKPLKNQPPVLRWTLDLRILNSHTKVLQVNLPQIESNILQLQNSKYFSALDLSSAYFHLKVAKSSQKYLFLNGPNSFVKMLFMPFGAANSGAFFTLWIRNLHNSLPKHLQKRVVLYLDDLLLHTVTLELHFEVLK